MQIRFHVDHSGQPHIHRHAVTEAEVRDVLASSVEDRVGAEGSRIAVGQTEGGRILKVIYVPDSDGLSVFVITAYQPGPKALRALRRRLRKRS